MSRGRQSELRMTRLQSTTTTPDHHWVLNPTRAHLRLVRGKGRGVFATHPIPPRTVIEISPVLLFSKKEYNDHGKHTLLDHYTFHWRDGHMALALGLGSLFNHAETPNVSFSVDAVQECIVYTSTRAIEPDEELCIFYGHQLWFDPVEGRRHAISDSDEKNDLWGGLTNIPQCSDEDNPSTIAGRHAHIDDVVQETDLPFSWIKLGLEREEERPEDLALVQAWVVDIPDPKHIATMLRWLKQSGLDTDALSHLKRVRRRGPLATLLLDTSPVPPTLPPLPRLEPAYQLPVPSSPARTPTSLSLKNTIWPTVFCPKRKWEPEPWTEAQVHWASDAVRRLKRAAAEERVQHADELPIVVHVPAPHADGQQGPTPRPSFFAHDTRRSTRHPLRHAVLDVIRQIGDDRSAQQRTAETESSGAENARSAQYLLTGLTVFATHEPCLMCTMALLHSRVKHVFYLVPMPKTGGCGGAACVPALKGVNHRFSIAVWKADQDDWPSLVDAGIDA